MARARAWRAQRSSPSVGRRCVTPDPWMAVLLADLCRGVVLLLVRLATGAWRLRAIRRARSQCADI
jgi:hypothetical protein